MGQADLQRVVPLARWDIDLAYEPSNVTGRMTMYTRFGAFCTDVADFDAAAFRTPTAEAAAMDPQQRLLLQAAAEGLADAQACTGQAVGTFTGQRPAAVCCADTKL